MTAKSNVTALPGCAVPRQPDEPVGEVVRIAEELLDMARSGVLRGIGVALVVADPQPRTETRLFSGPTPGRHMLIAAVAHLRYATDTLAWPLMDKERTTNGR